MNTPALRVTATAPVASFRDPMYSGVAVGLPVPPPSTVGGMLAAAAGGWDNTPPTLRFAMCFHATGAGVDLETYHPIHTGAEPKPTTIRERPFLADCTLTLWLLENLDWWHHVLREPVYPTSLGRSQDLAVLTTDWVTLTTGLGQQGRALLPADVSDAVGEPLQLSTAVSVDRLHVRWDVYRYADWAPDSPVQCDWVTEDGQALAVLPSPHPAGVHEPPR